MSDGDPEGSLLNPIKQTSFRAVEAIEVCEIIARMLSHERVYELLILDAPMLERDDTFYHRYRVIVVSDTGDVIVDVENHILAEAFIYASFAVDNKYPPPPPVDFKPPERGD